MTRKLYYEDPYISEFDAEVVSCEEKNGRYIAVFDRTAFFPTGGGQEHDTGTADGITVCDVYEKDGVVFHELNAPLTEGKTVFCRLDFDRRFSFMQNHSGEHILSGTVHRMLGYNNVGFHMGSDFVTVDFDGPMTEDQILEAEEKTNDVIFSNADILTYFPPQKELDSLDYRSKKELSGAVRIVEIPSVDICACCGTHVKKTGEIGFLKVVEHMNYKGGVRLFILSGKRALEDYRKKNRELYRISTMLSKKPFQTADGVEKLIEDLSQKKYEYSLLSKKYAENTVNNTAETDGILFFRNDGADSDFLRLLALSASKKCRTAVVCSQDGDNSVRCVVASEKTDARTVFKALGDTFSGKGGGKEALCQGMLHTSADKIADFIAKL
jgi:alanyl-tRNA synthetase